MVCMICLIFRFEWVLSRFWWYHSFHLCPCLSFCYQLCSSSCKLILVTVVVTVALAPAMWTSWGDLVVVAIATKSIATVVADLEARGCWTPTDKACHHHHLITWTAYCSHSCGLSLISSPICPLGAGTQDPKDSDHHRVGRLCLSNLYHHWRALFFTRLVVKCPCFNPMVVVAEDCCTCFLGWNRNLGNHLCLVITITRFSHWSIVCLLQNEVVTTNIFNHEDALQLCFCLANKVACSALLLFDHNSFTIVVGTAKMKVITTVNKEAIMDSMAVVRNLLDHRDLQDRQDRLDH